MLKESANEGNREFTSPLTLVLIGRKGTGKSATGNSILGEKIFHSEQSLSQHVTTTSEMKTTNLKDGQTLNVIDTPGLFESCVDVDFDVEMSKCISLAGDIGIHAFVLVLSVCSRSSKEQEAVISSLRTLFGKTFTDYMIVVFTGGDELIEDGITLDDFLCDSPEALKETLDLCGKRRVLFDNKTKDETQRANQLDKLLSLVNMVSKNNGGKPYNNELFIEFKEKRQMLHALETKQDTEHEISALKDQMHDEEQLKQIIGMVEPALKETSLKLERELVEERAARMKTEEDAKIAKEKWDEEIRSLERQVENAKRNRIGRFAKIFSPCVIM